MVAHPKEGEIVLTDDYEALGFHYVTAIMPVQDIKALLHSESIQPFRRGSPTVKGKLMKYRNINILIHE